MDFKAIMIDHKFLFALVAFIVIDIITGILNAGMKHEVNSTKMREGIVKKFYIFIVIAVSHILSIILDADYVEKLTICFYCAEEALSIIENTGAFIKYPPIITEAIEKIRSIGKEKEENK